MRIESACTEAFARHESFHPRYGWINRAVTGASRDPHLFLREDALVTLGVGKNMVRAIKYWGLATKVLATQDNPENSRVPLVVPSVIGRALLLEDGWDPYLEDVGTLWLLHWLLLAPRSLAPVWWVALNEFSALSFTADGLESFVIDYISGVSQWEAPQASSLKKDVSCFLRMYTSEQEGARATNDDRIDCPFRELGILRASDSRRGFRFTRGLKPTLPDAIALYACLDFAAWADGEARTMTLSRLASEAGGPGRAFRIDETQLTEMVTRATSQLDEAAVVRVAGSAQLAFHVDPAELATSVLWRYYRRFDEEAARHEEPLAGPRSRLPVDSTLAGTTAGSL